MECTDPDGAWNEYVVKFYGSIETGRAGLLCEIVASQLATVLGLHVPEPAMVNVRMEFAASIPDPSVRGRISKSVGLNFGSKNMTGGYVTWPREKNIPADLRQQATETYFFDMLIQNPDRRRDKPNILWKGEDLFLIDHEMAFSFLLDIVRPKDPWKISELSFSKDHLFHAGLKGGKINLDRMAGALESISEETWAEIESNLPETWKSDAFSRIRDHFDLVQSNIEPFMNDVRRSLV